MATGRGRFLQQQWLGLQALRLPLGGVGAAPESDRFRSGPDAQAAAFRPPGKQPALGDGPWGRPCPPCPAWLDSMPAEILLKILSYLDAAALLCMGCVNRRLYHLANDKCGRRPRWCSLVARYSLRHVTDSAEMGGDHLVRLFRLDPGLLVGLWKREEELAFVMANLHVSHLVERSALGSATVPYELPPPGAFADDGPECGLRGYQLHVDLHSGGAFCLCSTFHNLSADPGGVENGSVELVVIHLQNRVEHLPLVGEVGLCWRTEVVDGCVKSCSIMDLTLLDEYGKPFWCFSSPVCMRPCPGPRDSARGAGQTSRIDYEDAAGAVHMELVRVRETKELFIVSLVLRLSLARINRWFGTQY